MQNLSDQNKIKNYSKEFTQKIIEQAYSGQSSLNGHSLLSLTPVKQVNLLVVKSLLFQWKKEIEKLESPYFDYKSNDVKKALSTFMNVVSRHISVKASDLRPLLEEATYESICLIFYPYDYYSQLINNWMEDKLALKDLKQINKYLKVNDGVMVNLVARMEEQNLQSIDKKDATDLFNNILEHTDLTPADTDEYLSEFNKVHPLSLEDIDGATDTVVSEPATEEEKREEKPKKEAKVKVEAKEPEEIDERKPLVREEKAKKSDVDKDEKDPQPSTLNDEMQSEDFTTLNNIHEKQKIDKIGKYISINQKFMFINKLFDKDWGKFEKAISFLDQTDDKDAIAKYLDEHAPTWRSEEDEAEEFRAILEKKLGTTPI